MRIFKKYGIVNDAVASEIGQSPRIFFELIYICLRVISIAHVASLKHELKPIIQRASIDKPKSFKVCFYLKSQIQNVIANTIGNRRRSIDFLLHH